MEPPVSSPVDARSSGRTAGLTLRERKRAQAKAKVVDVALGLFAERGYSAVSVAEICAAADVAERSFFRYFPTKDDVLVEPLRRMGEQMAVAIVDAPETLDDEATLERGLRALAGSVIADWDRMAIVFAVAAAAAREGRASAMHLADQEREIARSLQRRTADGPAPTDADAPVPWPLRLQVAVAVSAFRVWLDDIRSADVADPFAHLDVILAARRG